MEDGSERGRIFLNGAGVAATRSRGSRFSRKSGKKSYFNEYFAGDGKLGAGQTVGGRRPRGLARGYVPPVIQHGTFWGELVVQELRILW